MSVPDNMESVSPGRAALEHGTPRSLSLRDDALWWMAAAGTLALLGVLYYDALRELVRVWTEDENYGHGFFIPLISGYLIWEKRHELAAAPLRGSWAGLGCVLVAVGLYALGELATLYAVLHLSLWLMVAGLALALIGFAGLRIIAFPIAFLITMIPLPQFLFQRLSAELQLLSSALGVGCLQFVGVTAFREGNVIDLGPIQLQVVEACSGLRYLFPLASLALLCAYLFKDRLWKRVLLFLSSFPISIVLNGFRIGMIGILVDLYGEGLADGFAHFFEGWLIFVVSLGLLFAEMWVLARIGGRRRPFLSLLSLGASMETVTGRPAGQGISFRPSLKPVYLTALAVLFMTSLVSTQGHARDEVSPPRTQFVDFPLQLDTWVGTPLVMEQTYRDVLRFDDYLLVDYQRSQDAPVNLYVAYYQSQKKGQSAHSPRTCIPGGGWEIVSMEDLDLHEAMKTNPMSVNRVLIQKGDERQLVMYWFQQRGRALANEYLVKWYLLWDAVTRQRTDGALVRLTTPVAPGEADSAAEHRLVVFADTVRPLLQAYVPD